MWASHRKGRPVGEYELTVGPDAPVDGSWSISVLYTAGYFEPDERGAYSVPNITAARNDDGSVTVRFWLVVMSRPRDNSLPITEGLNYLVRLQCPRRRNRT